MAVIEVAGIGKSYPVTQERGQRGARVAVLREIDLRLEAGGVLGLLGPNGAGKTTLIKILAGLLRPDSGGGRVLGYDLLRRHREIRARVSLVAPTADVGIDNNLTVRQNLAFWAPIYGLRGVRARERIDELLARLDLHAKADAWPMHISAGQRQRLALARSLLARNPLVFLDEPTNKLDLDGVRSVRALIGDLNRMHGVTIVLTTHVMEEAEELCDSIALLRQGVLVTHQPTGDLTRSLGLTRPIRMIVRGELEGGALDADGWCAHLRGLPGVTRARVVASGNEEQQSAACEPHERGAALDSEHATEGHTIQIALESLDLRASTPALLGWVRARGLRLVSMRAEPVTLEDVFRTLAGGDAGLQADQNTEAPTRRARPRRRGGSL